MTDEKSGAQDVHFGRAIKGLTDIFQNESRTKFVKFEW